MRKFFAVALFGLSLFIQAAFQGVTAQNDAGTNPYAVGYTDQKFDLNATELPAHYKGNNPSILWNKVRDGLVKSEFETTEAHKKRVAESGNMPIDGELKLSDTFATLVELGNGNARIAYNADKAVMNVEVISTGDFVELPLPRKEKILGSYKGQNSFGATAEIVQIERKDLSLIFTNYKAFGFKWKIYSIMPFVLPMVAEKAMKAKPNLRLLAVYKLVSPFVGGKARPKTTPTITSPAEYTVINYYLHTEVAEFWFYDFETGEIYLKVKPKKK